MGCHLWDGALVGHIREDHLRYVRQSENALATADQ